MTNTVINGTAYTPTHLNTVRKTILAVRQFGLWSIPTQACIVAQLVESSLLGPIWRGDTPTTTSRGAYQQEDAWVPAHVRNTDLDPRHTIHGSTMLFLYGGYDRTGGTPGLLDKDWVNQPIGVTVQQVQGSNTPAAYTKALPDAAALTGWAANDLQLRVLLAAWGNLG